jgi:hypothetical protein
MSFAERNKAWLLPLLGVVALGVVYLNIQTLQAPAAPAAPPGPSPALQTTAPPSAPAQAGPEPRSAGPADLWSDLRRLEGPSPALNQTQEILGHAAEPLDSHEPAPALRPQTQAWTRLTNPSLPAPPRDAQAPPAVKAAPAPLPTLSFVATSSSGPQAWLDGRPYAVGQTTPGGYRVQRILADRVVLEGPTGTVECFTHGFKLDSSSPKEAP